MLIYTSSDSSDLSEEISHSLVICLVTTFSLTIYLNSSKDAS